MTVVSRLAGVAMGIGRRSPHADGVGVGVDGVAHLSASDVRALLDVAPGSLMSTNAARGARIQLPTGEDAWPIAIVRERAVARGLDATRLGSDDVATSRFVTLPAARALHPELDDVAFLRAVESRAIPTVLVQPLDGGELLRMVPAHGLPQPAAIVDDAIAGAATVSGSTRTSASAATRHWRSTLERDLTVGAGIGLGAAVLVSAVRRSGSGGEDSHAAQDQQTSTAATPAATIAPAETATPEPTKREAAPEAPAAPAPSTESPAAPAAPAAPTAAPAAVATPAERKRAARGAKIASVARAEIGVAERFDSSGRITSRVKKYFSTSTQAQPYRTWDWPGYFVAWTRDKAGAPIAPAGGDWKFIDDLVDEARSNGTWRGPNHEPQPGDVVFFTRKGANSAAIVVKVTGDRMKVIEGGVKDGDTRAVARRSMSTSAPRIRGYAVVPD